MAAMVRSVIEVVVLTIGWILGGTVGLGTVLIAVVMGPLVQLFLRVTTVRLASDRAVAVHGDTPAPAPG